MSRSRVTGRIKHVAAVGVFVAIVAACGGSDSGDAYKEPSGPPVATLKLESGNTFFKPETLKAPPGVLEFDLTNIESGIHDLVIRDVPGFMVEVSGDGDESSGKVDLKKGKYEFYCSIPGHEEAGMKGTLTVS